jgi:isoamylase
LDWEGLDEDGKTLLEFTRRLVALRRAHIVFHRSRFFHGQIIPGTEVKDVTWLRPDGHEMCNRDWEDAHAKAIGIRISGEAGLMHLTPRGDQERDDTYLIFMNASDEDIPFRLADAAGGAGWQILVDTGGEPREHRAGRLDGATELSVKPRSLVLLLLVQDRNG